MAAETELLPQYDFSANGGQETTDNGQIDASFLDVINKLNELIRNKAKIQRDDLALANGIVTMLSLSDDVTAVIAANSEWKYLLPGADAATIADITLSGEQTIDGVATSTSRVLVKNQTDASENGIYLTDAGAWTREADLDSGSEADLAFIKVLGGSTQLGSFWLQVNSNVVIGTDDQNWQQFGEAPDISAIEEQLPYRLYETKGASFNVTAADSGKVFLCDTSSGDITVTTDAPATLGEGFYCTFKKIDALNNLITPVITLTELDDTATIGSDGTALRKLTGIQAAAITTARLVDLSVTTAKLAASAVTTAKINNLAVTTAKISEIVGKINAASSVTLNGNTNLDRATHAATRVFCEDAGTPADYTLTLVADFAASDALIIHLDAAMTKQVTLDAGGGNTINGGQTQVLNKGDSIYLINIGTDNWITVGTHAITETVAKTDILQGGVCQRNSNSEVGIGKAGDTNRIADSSREHVIEWIGQVTADIIVSGAGGLDTGSEQANQWYAIHIIADSTGVNAPAAMLSVLEDPTANLPTGYDLFRRLGWVRNKSSNFLDWKMVTTGVGRYVMYMEDPRGTMAVLSGGNNTGWTDVDCSEFVPATSEFVNIMARFNNAGNGGHDLKLRDKNDNDRQMEIVQGVAGTSHGSQSVDMSCNASQIIQYQVTDNTNSADIGVRGYIDNIAGVL